MLCEREGGEQSAQASRELIYHFPPHWCKTEGYRDHTEKWHNSEDSITSLAKNLTDHDQAA